MKNNIESVLNFLGLLYKGRGVVFGDVLLNYIKSKKVSLVLYSSDSGPSVKKKLLDKCCFYNIDTFEFSTTENLAKAIGKSQISSLGIIDKKAANKILNLLKKESTSDEK